MATPPLMFVRQTAPRPHLAVSKGMSECVYTRRQTSQQRDAKINPILFERADIFLIIIIERRDGNLFFLATTFQK